MAAVATDRSLGCNWTLLAPRNRALIPRASWLCNCEMLIREKWSLVWAREELGYSAVWSFMPKIKLLGWEPRVFSVQPESSFPCVRGFSQGNPRQSNTQEKKTMFQIIQKDSICFTLNFLVSLAFPLSSSPDYFDFHFGVKSGLCKQEN